MKKCLTCGNQNADDMRFCLNCGKPLADSPIVFNLQDSGSQSGPGTNPYGQTAQTQFGGNRGFNQNQFSMVPPSRPSSNKKMFIAIGGVVALFFLVLLAVGGIVGYNVLKKKDPTPTPTPTASPSVSPTPTASPKSPTPTPTPKDTPTKSTTDGKAKFERIWVDYNITEEGRLGMRIHVKFEVSNMKDVDSYLIINFQKDDGTKLRSSGGEFSNDEGYVAVKKALKPGYDVTIYKDLEVFMPYSELNLSSGKYNLKMDVDLADDDEALIQHLTFEEFRYTKE